MKSNALFQNIFLGIVSSVLTILLAELGCQYYINHLTDETAFQKYGFITDLYTRYQEEAYIPYFEHHRYLGYTNTPHFSRGKNQHNALGYRGEEITLPKPQNEFRIVCIGGSTTYTENVEDYRQSYPYLLEKELKQNGYSNISVVNAGVGGWGSIESMINFGIRILDLEPDLVIIHQGINDIHTRFVWPAQYYKGDNSGMRGTNGIFVPPLIEHSALYRILMVNLGLLQPHNDVARMLDSRKASFIQPYFKYQKAQGVYPSSHFKEISAKDILAINQPVYFQRNLENILAMAKHHGIKTILATQAHCTDPIYRKEYPGLLSEEYITALQEMNHVSRKIAQKNHVPLFDFASEFPDTKEFFSDGYHVNEKGAALKAKGFAEFLIENKLIPKSEN